MPQPAAQSPSDRVTGSVRVTASTLNVRATASTSADVVSRVRRGTRLDVLGEEGSWLKVRLSSGEVGWVSAQHVSRGDAPAASASSGRSRRSGGCPPDSDYRFVKAPVPSFSEGGPHGLVVVEAEVDSDGVVRKTRVISNGTGEDALAEIAEREIRTSRFVAPVRNCVRKPFIFTYKRTF